MKPPNHMDEEPPPWSDDEISQTLPKPPKQSNLACTDRYDSGRVIELDTWPEPIPLFESTDLELTAEMIGGVVGEYVSAVAAATETPVSLAASLCLAVAATCAARFARIAINADHSEPLNLWVVGALQSGNRKSSVLKLMQFPLTDWEKERAREIAPMREKASTEKQNLQARITYLRGAAARHKSEDKRAEFFAEIEELVLKLPKIPEYPRLFTGDVTPEQLAALTAENGECMAVFSSEGSSIFENAGGRYANGLANLDFLLQSHSGDDVRIDRKNSSPLLLDRPLLSMGLSPQPQVVSQAVKTPSFRSRGLMARFLYIFPVSPLGSRTHNNPPIPPKLRASYFNAISDLLASPPGVVLVMSPEATAIHHAYKMEIEEAMKFGGRFDFATDWAGKAPGACARIAGVLHSLNGGGGTAVSEETMERAVSMMRVFEQHALVALQLSGADSELEEAELVWRWLEQSGPQRSVTKSELQQALKSRFKRKADIEGPLMRLVDHNYIRVEEQVRKPGQRGAPASPFIRVNPKLIRDRKDI